MSEQRMIKITLVRSPIGQTERQRATLRGLGLTRIGRSVMRHDTPPVRGMIGKVQHLIRVEG
jgi:large subunit ribosomal protein L30